MPFVVYDGSRRVSALDCLHPTIWREFRDDTELVERLRFACCGAPVVPKTSPYGLPFFAHAAGRACEASGARGQESFRHQLLKAAAQSFFRSLPGWSADVEVRHERPAFVSDVLASHPDGRRLAVEVQLAQQGVDSCLDRTRARLAGGVKTAWLAAVWSPVFAQFEVAHLHLHTVRAAKLQTVEEALALAGYTRQWDDSRTMAVEDYLAALVAPGTGWHWNGRLRPEADPDLPDPEWRQTFRRTQPSLQPVGRPSGQREALAAIDAEAAADTRPADDPARIRDRYSRLNAAAKIISDDG